MLWCAVATTVGRGWHQLQTCNRRTGPTARFTVSTLHHAATTFHHPPPAVTPTIHPQLAVAAGWGSHAAHAQQQHPV